jgi:ribonucleoside-diphosphate reductase alpha chain
MSEELKPFEDEYAKETWENKTKYGSEKNVLESWNRIVNSLISVEKPENKDLYYKLFLEILSKFNTLGGRIMSNIGTEGSGSLFNCYVLLARLYDRCKEKGVDSMESINEWLSEQSLTLKSEGGYGTSCSFLRPRGAFVRGIRSETPGPIAMLDMLDMQADVITRGSGLPSKDKRAKKIIRKGAQMVTMDVWCPDIEEFIDAKQVPGRLTKFNMSVYISDDFMEAVLEDKDWNLRFPDTSFEKYNQEWDGDIYEWERKKYPVIIYKTVKAKKIYDKIMKSCYSRAEPGVLFRDRINKLNNLYYCEKISSTNPCGEQPLPDGGVCLLGSINLVSYVNKEATDWDYEALGKDIPIHIRMLDNVNDIGKAPLPIQNENIKNKRRIGQGILGYGSALMLLKCKYGSERALELTEKFCKFWSNTAYKTSALLAKEKGSFPLFDKEKYLKSEYLKVLDEDTINMIRKYGIRNSHILSIAPTGNTGIYANMSSGGLEPVFSAEYIRTAVTEPPEGLNVYKKEDILWEEKKEYKATSDSNWEWIKEGDERMLKTSFEGTIYKIDRNRGLTKEVKCIDWGVRKLKERGEWDEHAEWAKTALNLSPEDHINTMKIFSKYIDSALSKTVNLPNNYSFKNFENLYIDAWKTGTIKGLTTYRAGTMGEVLKDMKKGDKKEVIIKEDIKLPSRADAEMFILKSEGAKWYLTVTHWNINGKNEPFAIFVNTNQKSKTVEIRDANKALENLALSKGISKKWVNDQIEKCKDVSNVDKVSRMISLNLRHGVSIASIVKTISDTKPIIGTLVYHLMKFLSKYIEDGTIADIKCPECGGELVYIGNCPTCKNCSYAKC